MKVEHKIGIHRVMSDFYTVFTFCVPTFFDYLPQSKSDSYNNIKTRAPYRLTFPVNDKNIYISITRNLTDVHHY